MKPDPKGAFRAHSLMPLTKRPYERERVTLDETFGDGTESSPPEAAFTDFNDLWRPDDWTM